MITSTRVHRGAAAFVLLAGVGLAACGDSDSGSSDSTLATSEASVVVSKQWARTSPMATTTGAAYMDIAATAGDELTSASVDASVAGTVELHEVVMSGGSMTMQQVEKIVLPAGETVSLKPGGYHVMLLGLAKPLAVGDTVPVTLTFATAGEITVGVPVLDEAP
ncbi:MAG: copper chaperone PCu(A)C [Ilumatobacteraceae bacterium]